MSMTTQWLWNYKGEVSQPFRSRQACIDDLIDRHPHLLRKDDYEGHVFANHIPEKEG